MNFKLTKSSLNFKVYTSPTIPSSGTENDIVIISTTPMENWILSSDIPVGEPRNRGDVWIQYSVSGNVFDIMNQHDFMLSITKIYQYVGRTWVSVNARRYVGGVWDVVSSAFSATINITYPANSTCVVTNSNGQTVASDTNATSSEKTWTATVGATGTYTVTATATDGSGKSKRQDVSIESDGQSVSVSLSYELILLSKADGLASDYRISGKAIAPAIDITNYSTMAIVAKATWKAASSYGVYVGVSTSASSTNDFPAEAYVTSTSERTYNIDISELTGSYYVRSYDSMSFSDGAIEIESGGAGIEVYSIEFR